MNLRFLMRLLALLCAPTFVAAETTHTFGVDITDYDDHIEGQSRTFELDTRQYGLSYALGLESGVGVTLSGWQSAADTDWSANADLEREQQGWQVGVSMSLDAHYRLALTYAQSDADTWLHFDNGSEPYREQADSWSLGASLARDWYWQQFSLSPSLGLSYQEFSSSLWQQIQFRRGGAVNQHIDQQDQGWSADASVNLAYDIEQSAQLLWSPYLTLNWLEPLTLDSALSQTSTLQRGSLSRSRSSRSTLEANDGGSGVYALGLFVLWQDWSADLSWSDTFSTQTNTGAQLRFGVSRSF